MRCLRNARDYGIGATPLHRARGICHRGQLFLKLEQFNATGSIKARTAYFLLRDLLRRGALTRGTTIVESTSGNLGLGFAALAEELGVKVVCLVDQTVAEVKIERLQESGAETRLIECCGDGDFRSARIAEAQRLGEQTGWVWPNQYGSDAAMLAHEETTAPEICEALHGYPDVVVASVGTGGTLLGIARAFKAHQPHVQIIAIEPAGSTIFGGLSHDYISAGAGLRAPSLLLRRYGRYIDRFSKVSDNVAIEMCHTVAAREPFTVGITAGAAIVVAAHVAAENPNRVVVAIVPDAADNYRSLLHGPATVSHIHVAVPVISDATEWYRNLVTL